MGREREPGFNLALYHLFKWSVVAPLFHSYFRGAVYGAEHVPMTGPLVIVANHGSYFDPPMLSNCVRRPVAFMAKTELFQVPVLKQAISAYGAYPVQRSGADQGAIKAALGVLEQGWATGIFLQGTRTEDGRIDNPKLGALLIAAKANAPILPVCLWGTEKILQGKSLPNPTPITVRIAPPLPAPESSDRAHLQALTSHCTDIINALHDQGR
ncbi:MAG: lysophospholipid acyltransferase family protein [Cyanobacteria bacterium P01_H01_bin.15]